MTNLTLPAGVPGFAGLEEASPLFQRVSLFARDPNGGISVPATQRCFLCIDTVSRTVTHSSDSGNDEHSAYQLLGFADVRNVLVRQGASILRVDSTTGEPTVLFPRR